MPHYVMNMPDEPQEEVSSEEVVELICYERFPDNCDIGMALFNAKIDVDFDLLATHQKIRLVAHTVEFVRLIYKDDFFFTKLAVRDPPIMRRLKPAFTVKSLKYLFKHASRAFIERYHIDRFEGIITVNTSPLERTDHSVLGDCITTIANEIHTTNDMERMEEIWPLYIITNVIRITLYEYCRYQRIELLDQIIRLLSVPYLIAYQESMLIRTITILNDEQMIEAMDDAAIYIFERIYKLDLERTTSNNDIVGKAFGVLKNNRHLGHIKDFIFENSLFIFTEYKKNIITSGVA